MRRASGSSQGYVTDFELCSKYVTSGVAERDSNNPGLSLTKHPPGAEDCLSTRFSETGCEFRRLQRCLAYNTSRGLEATPMFLGSFLRQKGTSLWFFAKRKNKKIDNRQAHLLYSLLDITPKTVAVETLNLLPRKHVKHTFFDISLWQCEFQRLFLLSRNCLEHSQFGRKY